MNLRYKNFNCRTQISLTDIYVYQRNKFEFFDATFYTKTVYQAPQNTMMMLKENGVDKI